MSLETEQELAGQLKRMEKELDDRAARHAKVLPYSRRVEDQCPVPRAIVDAKLTKVYWSLMAMSETPWGKLIVNSKLDRLEMTGIKTGIAEIDDRVWQDVWQGNQMDLESKLAHRSALLDGRAHALVWPDPDTGLPEITLDDSTQMVIAFREGSRRKRIAALRRWLDDANAELSTLYRPDGIYKFRRKAANEKAQVAGSNWVRREMPDEAWPMPNPYKIVPAVELAVNRQLEPGQFTFARGEFEDEMGLMDRINLLTFLGLVVAIWMGFPLRYVIGDTILKDDDGNTIPPFESRPDSVVQFEDDKTQVGQLEAADRGNLSIFDELAQLAAATSTPRHYFPMGGSIANVSEATIRAFEGGMHAAVNGSHKPSLGEGWEEVCRIGGLMLPQPVEVPAQASAVWADHESRSLGERADAFLKLSQGNLPWAASAELALNLGQDELRRYEQEMADSPLAKLFKAAQETALPVPVA